MYGAPCEHLAQMGGLVLARVLVGGSPPILALCNARDWLCRIAVSAAPPVCRHRARRRQKAVGSRGAVCARLAGRSFPPRRRPSVEPPRPPASAVSSSPCCCRFCWCCLLLLAPPARLGCPGVERAEYLSRPGAPLPGAAAKGSFCEVSPAPGGSPLVVGLCCCLVFSRVGLAGCLLLFVRRRGRLLCLVPAPFSAAPSGPVGRVLFPGRAEKLPTAAQGCRQSAKRALLRSFRAPPLPVLSPFVPRAPGWAVGAGSLCVSSAFVLVVGRLLPRLVGGRAGSSTLRRWGCC